MSKGRLAALVACALLLGGCAHAPGGSGNGPVAAAPAGAFRGTADSGVHVWRGIRYAEAPVGERRWKAPLPVADAAGEVAATQFGASCIQPEARADMDSIYADDPGPLSEDCLSLNVWSAPGAKQAPVLVWIHGGALVSGSSRLGLYSGAHLAHRGLVVVSINYRLGALGYLAHPELSAESPDRVSGNYGLLDQVAALRWVERNIAAFGGDPANVTIAGESAGALSAMYLMASPLARGLFDRVAAQSAYMVSTPGLKQPLNGHPPAEAVGTWLQGKLGADSLTEMRAVPAHELGAKAAAAGFMPQGTIDGHVLPRQIVETFDRGEQAKVPLIVGFNAGEIRSLRRLLPPIPAGPAEYEAKIRAAYGSDAGRFLRNYPAADVEESMLAATRDALYGWTAQRMAIAQHKAGVPAYLYLFDHGYPAADEAGLHAFHASEIPFVFGTIHETAPKWPQIPRTPQERALADAMMAYWAAFARTGRPRAADSPHWPRFGTDERYLHIADRPEATSDPLGDRYELYEETVCRRRVAGDQQWNWNVGVAAAPLPPQAPQCR